MSGKKVPEFKPLTFMEWAKEKKQGKWKHCQFCTVKVDPNCPKCGGEIDYFEPYSTAPDKYRREVAGLKAMWDKFHGVKESE